MSFEVTNSRLPQGTALNGIEHFRTTEPISLVECLVERFNLTRAEGERLVSLGAIYEERRRVNVDRMLAPGRYIRAHLRPKRFPAAAVNWGAALTHQGDEFVVVNKPAGIPTHATVDNCVENVLEQMRSALGVPLLITQRLDTDVGGLIVFARTPEFQRKFNRMLLKRRVDKRYRALVTPRDAVPEEGRYIHYMEPSPRSPKTVGVEARADWLECALRVTHVVPAPPCAGAPGAFEVEIALETGRTHQIRAQLAALGSPIIGDRLYGSETDYAVSGESVPGIALFSASIQWRGPDSRAVSFKLAPPWITAR